MLCRSLENITLHGFPHDVCFVHDIWWKIWALMWRTANKKVSFFFLFKLPCAMARFGICCPPVGAWRGPVCQQEHRVWDDENSQKAWQKKGIKCYVLHASYLGSKIIAGTRFLILLFCSGFVRVFLHPSRGVLVCFMALVLFSQISLFHSTWIYIMITYITQHIQ